MKLNRIEPIWESRVYLFWVTCQHCGKKAYTLEDKNDLSPKILVGVEQ